MDKHLTLNVDKIHRKFEYSTNREYGVEIQSNIRGLKYIVKGDSVIFSTIKNGVFAIGIAALGEFTGELLGIKELYGK